MSHTCSTASTTWNSGGTGSPASAAHARNWPCGDLARVLLPQCPRGRVARVHEGGLAGLDPFGVHRLEVRQGVVDLAPDLDDRRRVVDVQPVRDGVDREQLW